MNITITNGYRQSPSLLFFADGWRYVKLSQTEVGMSLAEQQLKVFKEVAEAKNITLASKKLHMSQPSVSIQIQSLENDYGVQLFERTNKGVSLTEAGWIFYQHVCQVVQIMQETREKIAKMGKSRRSTIQLGATLTIGEYILPHLIDYLYDTNNDQNGEIEFNVKVANTEVVSQDILERKLHIALVEGPVPDSRDFVIENFWQDELALVVAADHRWANRKSVSFEELTTERMITREQGSGTRRVMELAIEQAGFDLNLLNITAELGSTQAIKQAVVNGLGVTIISALTVQQKCKMSPLRLLEVQGCSLKRPLNILTHVRAIQTEEERLFVAFLKDRKRLETIFSPQRNATAKTPHKACPTCTE